MSDSHAIEQISSASRRRPGPFGPAWALLPQDQQLAVVDEQQSGAEVLERMVDEGFSQIPVMNREQRVVGVFTWASFSKRVLDLQDTKINVAELAARELMEPPRFISPDTYIDTETDWGQIDYVLVGDASEVTGILCISDVLGRLNDFAEAFVLIYEIEHAIRDAIRDIVTENELTELIGQMQLPPNARPPRTLEDFTFNQYQTLICSKSNWPRFDSFFDTQRDLINADFGAINELRNIVFHFRRGITPKDTDRLRRFRDKLRYNRELWQDKADHPMTQAAVINN